MINIETVKSEKQLWDFIKLPWAIYKDDGNWVPPLFGEEKKLLDKNIHPFHKHAEVEYFLARKGGMLCGRIAAIINHRHNEFHNEKVGFFGFFECINDLDASNILFKSADEWIKTKGVSAVRGPCNFSTNETCGLLVDGFNMPPAFMMTYNKPYYISLAEANGYKKAADLLAYFLPAKEAIKYRFEKAAGLINQRNQIKIRYLDMRNFKSELAVIKEIYNKSWSKNWGFVPMTDEEFNFSANDFKAILMPEFACMAELEQKPVGFAFAVPDINIILHRLNGRLLPFGWLKILLGKNKLPVVRVVALGVLPEHQNKGIGTLFYLKFIEEAIKKGLLGGELSWVLETNELMNKPIRQMGAKPYKTYRIYEKVL